MAIPLQTCSPLMVISGLSSLILQQNTIYITHYMWPMQPHQELCRVGNSRRALHRQWSTISSSLFTAFYPASGIIHHISSPYHPESNGFVESTVKHTAVCWKYAVDDVYQAQHTFHNMPIDIKLPLPAELLYNCRLCTTLPAHILHAYNADGAWVHLEECTEHRQNDVRTCSYAPINVGQDVSVYEILKHTSIPSTFICKVGLSTHIPPYTSLCTVSVLIPVLIRDAGPVLLELPHCQMDVPTHLWTHRCVHLCCQLAQTCQNKVSQSITYSREDAKDVLTSDANTNYWRCDSDLSCLRGRNVPTAEVITAPHQLIEGMWGDWCQPPWYANDAVSHRPDTWPDSKLHPQLKKG